MNAIEGNVAGRPIRRPCPRCDYDMSGHVDAWTDRCPISGKCPECGLDFEWRRVLDPALTTPRWSFEHAPVRPRSLAKTWLLTVLMTLRPWRFWREMKSEHPVKWRRLVMFFITTLVMLHALFALTSAWYAWEGSMYRLTMAVRYGFAYKMLNPPDPNLDMIASLLWPYGRYDAASTYFWGPLRRRGGMVNAWPWVVGMWFVFVPMTLVPMSRSAAPFERRLAILARAAAYSGVPVIMVVASLYLLRLYAAFGSPPLHAWPGAALVGQTVIGGNQTPVMALAAVCSLFLWGWWSCVTHWCLGLRHAVVVSLVAVISSAVLGIMIILKSSMAGAFLVPLLG